jgi:ATP-binding cassette, subfamily B, bacterial
VTDRRRTDARLWERFPALAGLHLGRRRRTIPYVQQTAGTDCGAACLAMVLGRHGRRAHLSEVREVAGYGRDGADAASLLEAGRRFGLRGRAVKVARVEDLKYLPAASILHWRFCHFVVFESLDRHGIAVVDPAGGRRVLSWEEVRRSFTGIALTFEPGEGFEPRAKQKRAGSVARYLRQILGQSDLISRVLIASVLVQVLALALPLLLGALIDRVLPRGDLHLLSVLAVGLLTVVGFHLLASIVRAYLLIILRTRLDVRMTLDFLEHLLDLPYSFFQQRSAGDLMMRLNSNTTVREILTSGALSGLLDGLMVSLYLILLFAGNLRIGLIVFGLGILRVALLLLTWRPQKELMARSLEAQAEVQSYEVQMLAGVETLKASGTEPRAVEHWTNLFVGMLNVSLSRDRLSAFVDSTLAALDLASPIVVLLLGGLMVVRGDLSLGMMLALNALASGFLTPLSRIVSTAFQLQLLGSYLERIEDVLATPPEQPQDQALLVRRLEGRIRLEGVSFRYSSSSPLVVRDVSVGIEPGSFVALVGRSGAGKSTLASLLIGLVPPTSGRILYDGEDLARFDLRALRRQLGVVPQHPYLFGASIRATIALADPTLPLSDLVEAAKLASVHDDIMAMPMGYDTLIADGGASLSGGQRQRLALARALVGRPAVLLLDEATSALDAFTEQKIQDALGRLRCTRVVVAHRLSTIRHADLILVMSDGQVVERGTHDDLIARPGTYTELLAAQLEHEHEHEEAAAW